VFQMANVKIDEKEMEVIAQHCVLPIGIKQMLMLIEMAKVQGQSMSSARFLVLYCSHLRHALSVRSAHVCLLCSFRNAFATAVWTLARRRLPPISILSLSCFLFTAKNSLFQIDAPLCRCPAAAAAELS
jgi:hypothetical protein